MFQTSRACWVFARGRIKALFRMQFSLGELMLAVTIIGICSAVVLRPSGIAWLMVVTYLIFPVFIAPAYGLARLRGLLSVGRTLDRLVAGCLWWILFNLALLPTLFKTLPEPSLIVGFLAPSPLVGITLFVVARAILLTAQQKHVPPPG